MSSKIRLPELTVRQAVPDDLAGMWSVLLAFGGEGPRYTGRRYNRDQALNYLGNYILGERARAHVALHDGKVVAFCLSEILHWVWEEPDGFFDTLYVLPDYRGSQASRLMVAAALDEMRVARCIEVHACAISGMGGHNDRAYENLFKKFGFVHTGGRSLILNMGGKS